MRILISVGEKEKAKGAASPYFQAMLSAGARPEELEMVAAGDAERFSKADFHGILFTGGEDVDPALYDEKKEYDTVEANRARDAQRHKPRGGGGGGHAFLGVFLAGIGGEIILHRLQ